VGKRSLLVALATVLATLSLPAATALAAPAAGSHTSTSSPPVVVNLGNGQQLTLSTSGATCKATPSQPGAARQCSVTERVPLSDLPAAAQTERAAELQNATPAEAPSAAAAIPTSGPARCHFTNVEAFSKSATANPDRLTSCSDAVFAAVNYEITATPPFIEVTGFFWWEDQQWDIFRAARGNWTHGLVTLGYLLGASGTLAKGVTADLESSCDVFAGTCSATSATVPDPQPVAITPGSRHSYEWTESDAGPSSTTRNTDNVMNPDLGVFWEDISTTPAKEASDTGQLHGRCDRVVSAADGCVNQAFIPTVTYSALTHPLVGPVAQHIFTAQHTLSIAWGVPARFSAKGRVLTRDTSAADRRANNRAACSAVRLAAGQNCDEFPLASTFQGASFQKVFSAVAVPASANSSQGGITSGFYSSNHVLNHDPFYVLAILRNGSRSW
jgi:Deoxyribonuclease NucA/NucB